MTRPQRPSAANHARVVTASARFALDKTKCRTPGLKRPVPSGRLLIGQKRQDLRERGDAWALPLASLGPRRLFAVAMNEDRLRSDSLRAGELVVGAVPDEHRLLGFDR